MGSRQRMRSFLTLYLTKMEVMLLYLPQLIQMFGTVHGQSKKTGNSLKVTTISGGGNPSGGISGVRLMPGTSYAGTINTDLNLGRP